MKIVFQSRSRLWGGNEKWLLTSGSGLRDRGHEVTIACPPGLLAERARAAGLPVTHRRQRGFDPVSAARFAAWLRHANVDALIITSWRDLAAVALAARVARVSRVLLRLGILRQASPRSTPGLAIRRWVDDVIVNATPIRDALLVSLPDLPPERVHVVLNAVLPLRIDDTDRAALRAAMADDGRIIAAAGNVEPRKGFDLLLRALPALPDDARVAIIGDGPGLVELRSLAGSLGVAHRVRFLGRRPDAPSLIAASDVFALTSRNEGMANVMLEAMAAGLPIVATDVSGVREALAARDGRSPAGWIVPPDDVPALAAALTEALPGGGHRDQVTARAMEARWRATHWFGLERLIDDLERLLRLPRRDRRRSAPRSDERAR